MIALVSDYNKLKIHAYRILLVMILLLAAILPAKAETYRFSPGHSEIRFSWDHAGVSIQSGEFLEFSGRLEMDLEKPSESVIEVTINPESLHTGVSRLDYELKGKTYFDTRAHPEITFKSTSVTRTGKSWAEVTGDLTMKGVTKPVTLNVELVHEGEHPYGPIFPSSYSGHWLGFRASGALNRSDFGMGKYTPVTSDRIQIDISVEMKVLKE